MSSSVFFKFKSQKEPSRVTFDGTGISVFELKREIITINKLGDGTDFDLAIYNEDTNEEYDEDTTIIPRSTSITARRLPPVKPGRGTAQRYVNGKMPTMALNAGRIEKPKAASQVQTKKPENGLSVLVGNQSEEDRIAAMFAASSEQWSQTQEHMASATPIHRPGQAAGFKKGGVTAPAPNHPPPNGYICYRCGEKGHWIQQCPTNTDPNFDGRPRVKRTTGIPRSFLKTIEKPVLTSDDESGGSNPSAVMVNAEGEYVVAVADKASWESYQQKAAKSTAQATEDTAEHKEIEEQGLACPIDHKLFKDATKTPCCSKTYCEECIQTELLDSDFTCPNCNTKETYLDRLLPDEDMRKKVDDYEDGKREARAKSKSKSPSKSPPNTTATIVVKSGTPQPAAKVSTPTPDTLAPAKKRPADDQLTPDVARGPTAMLSKNNNSEMQRVPSNGTATNSISTISRNTISPQPANSVIPVYGAQANSNGNFNHQMNHNNGFQPNMNMNHTPNMNMSMNNMNSNMGISMNSNMGMGMGMNTGMNGLNNMNAYYAGNNYMTNGTMNQNHMHGMIGMTNGMGDMMGNMNMNMGMGMGMGPGMMNNGYNNNYSNNNMSYHNSHNMNMNMNQYSQSHHSNHHQQFTPSISQHHHQQQQFPQPSQAQLQFNGMNGMQLNMVNGGFSNQQRTVFSEPFPSEEDSAYMRKPVNPHRHLRPKRIRPSDFKPLGEI